MTSEEKTASILALKELSTLHIDDPAWRAIQNAIIALNAMEATPLPATDRIVDCKECGHCRPLTNGWYCFHSKKYVSAVIAEEKIETQCADYCNKHIQFPIEIQAIKLPQNMGVSKAIGHNSGILVAVRPCGKEGEEKTYLGILLGDISSMAGCSYNPSNKSLEFYAAGNPAIFIPELKRVVFGYESWWAEIKDETQLKEITDSDIKNTWYVKLLNSMAASENLHTEEKDIQAREL